MDWRHDLICLGEAFCAATGKSESRVGSLIGGTGIFYRRLRAGGDCSATVYQRAMQWFSDHWPDDRDDAPWPAGIDRPPRAPLVVEPGEKAA